MPADVQGPGDPGETDTPGTPAVEAQPTTVPVPVELHQDGELHLYFPVEVVVVGAISEAERQTIRADIWRDLHEALA
jgi:hypothetical protein